MHTLNDTFPIHEPKSLPTVLDAVAFRFKAACFQTERFLQNLIDRTVHRHGVGTVLSTAAVLAESKTRLWEIDKPTEFLLQAGKVHNLRRAVRELNGVEVPAGELFGFWAHIGRPSRVKGYVAGRELREGCVIPSIGGGLCQLSNALYDAALTAGFEIVERHAHSQVVPGSLAEIGRDATVFWNYVDLRFKSAAPFRIEAFLTDDHLVVRYRGFKAKPQPERRAGIPLARFSQNTPNSCASCGVQACFRNLPVETPTPRLGRTAFLVDDYWPEFDAYVASNKKETDVLGVPIDGRRFGKPNYAWTPSGFGKVAQSLLVTALRSLKSRNLSAQGAARQQSLLDFDERLALGYRPLLAHDVTNVVVSQNLLPHLWRDGVLGGRRFDVLMTRLPLAILHDRLDEASKRHADSPTLGDFRADSQLVEAEREALRAARTVVTPHREIAGLFPEKAVLLPWTIPSPQAGPRRGSKVIFPAPTVGRKGAYELRGAARELGLEIVLVGNELEGSGFWDGVTTTHRRFIDDWLADARVVALPALVEHRPRTLLEAIARGIPVIASTACGLDGMAGVTTVPTGDTLALKEALRRVLAD